MTWDVTDRDPDPGGPVRWFPVLMPPSGASAQHPLGGGGRFRAGRGKGVPQLSEAAPPPSTIHRLFLYIMYKVEGAGAMAMEAGIGARWGRETVTK